MACPSCRGSNRRVIAPGFWEGQSPVAVMVTGPGSIGRPGPEGLPVPSACGRRYHETPGTAAQSLCDCGTFAIGLCTQCHRPVCGDCSALHQGSRWCAACVAASEAAQRQDVASAALTAELRAQGLLSAFVSAMSLAGNPGAVDIWPIPNGFDFSLSRSEERKFRKAADSDAWNEQWIISKLRSSGPSRGWYVDTSTKRKSSGGTANSWDMNYHVTTHVALLTTGEFVECEHLERPVGFHLPPARAVLLTQVVPALVAIAAKHEVPLLE